MWKHVGCALISLFLVALHFPLVSAVRVPRGLPEVWTEEQNHLPILDYEHIGLDSPLGMTLKDTFSELGIRNS